MSYVTIESSNLSSFEISEIGPITGETFLTSSGATTAYVIT